MSSQINFLSLSSDICEPFVIPNVSPTSPQVAPVATDAPASPISDATIARDRAISVVELE